MFTFYHQGHELSKDFNHYKMELQINIQNTRNRFEGTRSEVEELMNKIRQNPKDQKRASQFTAEGYLYVQEKSKRRVLDSLGLKFRVVVSQMQVLRKNGKCSELPSRVSRL